jgi:hypothetical protein
MPFHVSRCHLTPLSISLFTLWQSHSAYHTGQIKLFSFWIILSMAITLIHLSLYSKSHLHFSYFWSSYLNNGFLPIISSWLHISLPFSTLLFYFCSFMLNFFLFLIIVVLGRGTLEYLQMFLQHMKYIMCEFTPSTAVFHPSLPWFRQQSQQVIFLHTLTSVYIICTTFPPHYPSAPLGRTCSAPLFFNFREEKT